MAYNPNASAGNMYGNYGPPGQQQGYQGHGSQQPDFRQPQYQPMPNQFGGPSAMPQQGHGHQAPMGGTYYPGTQPSGGYPEKQHYGGPPMPSQVPPNNEGSKAPWDPNQATAYSGTDMGSEDVGENDAEQSLQASAPSYDAIICGYENTGIDADVSVGPPPSYEESIQYTPAVVDTNRIPRLTDEDARHALLQLVTKSTCWGSGAAKAMSIKDIAATNAYHYVLETYTEGRSTSYAREPYKGGYIDAAHNGPAPLPWSIPCSPTAFFKTEQHKIPVPHTDVVRPCHLCRGRGFNRCGKCRGRGRVRCGFCHGRGTREVNQPNGDRRHEMCHSCHGNGRKRCHPCRGSGCVMCCVCQGYGSVKQFIQLTVSFTNRHNDHIIEKSDFPDELIRNVQGDTMFEQTALRVGPIQNFFEREINDMSKQLVDSHNSAWPTERVLQQRHYLRSVPVHECQFEYQSKAGRFWVYGHQQEVYTQDYPHTCCCCRCVIL